MAVQIEVREFTITTGTGNIDFTGFGFQPTACLFVMSGNATDNVDSTNENKSLGMCDGTRQWAMCTGAEDAVGTTDVGRRSTTSGCILHIDHAGSQAVIGKASFVSFLSTGVRVNRLTTFSSPTAPIVRIIAFGGTDVSAYGDIFDPNNTQNSTTSTTAPGFEADVIITGMIGNHEDSDGATENDDDSFSIGWAVNPSRQASNNQYCIGMASIDASAQTESRHGIWNNRCNVSRQDDVTDTAIEITAFSSTGFTATTRDAGAGANDRFFYLALKVGGSLARIFSVNQDMPVATGSQSQAGAGFRPQFLFGLAIGDDRGFNTWGTEADGNNSSIGVSMVDRGVRTYSLTAWDEDEAGTSNTGTRTRNTRSWSLNDQAGGVAHDATFTSFDSSGWTQSFTQFLTLTRNTVYLAFGGLITTKTFTCDAFLKATKTKTFTCDAFLKATKTKTFTCDAYLKATQTFNFLVDALLELETNKSFLVDALLRDTFDETFTIDARLSALEEFTVDAKLNKVAEFTIDAHIGTQINIMIDAYIVRTNTFTIDARLSKLAEFTCDSILVNRRTKTFTCDAYLVKDVYYSVDAILKARYTKTFTCDAILKATQTFNFLIDSLLEQEKTKLFLIDAFLELRQDKTYTVDSRLRKVQSKTFTCDALVKLVQTKTWTIDARVEPRKTFKIDGIAIRADQFKVDALLRQVKTHTFTCDSILIIFPSKVALIDSILVNRYDYTFTIDARLRARFTKIFTCDALLLKTQTKTFTCDAELITTKTKTYTIDARLKGIFSKTYLVDAFLRKTKTKTFTIDTFAEEATNKTFLIDGLLEKTFTKTFTIDTFAEEATNKTFTIDAFLRKTLTKTFTCDALLIVVPSKLTLIDALISLPTAKLFTVDAKVKLVSQYTFTCDARLRARFDKTFTIDSTLYLPIYKTFTVDANLITSANTKTFKIDALLKKTKTKTFLIDGIPTGAGTKIFLIDARLRARFTKTFTIQARLRYVRTTTYTVDALLKLTGDVLCSSLEPIFSDTFDTSTGWTQSGTVVVDSIARPNVLSWNCTGSGTLGQSYKTLPIPTPEEFRMEFTHNNIGGCTGFESLVGFGVTIGTGKVGASTGTVAKLAYFISPFDGPDGEGIRIQYRSSPSDPLLVSASAIPMTDNTTYYVRIDKNLASIITLSMFSDSARTIHVAGSPTTLDVSSQAKVPFTIVQASDSGGPSGSARMYTGEIEDLIIYADRCPNFLIDSFLEDTFDKTFTIDAILGRQTQFTIDSRLTKAKFKTFKIDAFFEAESTAKTFKVDALIKRIYRFSLDALIKALGDNRCPFENIFEEHFENTSNWTVEINNTLVDGWGVQKIFIDGESILSQELTMFGVNGFAYLQMPPGGYSGAMQPILKSKYRRKKLDSNGGIGRVRGNNIRVDFEFTSLAGNIGTYLALNKSSAHPDNDPNTATLNISAVADNFIFLGRITALLSDGFTSAITPIVDAGLGIKRYVSVESLGNTLTLNVYTDEAHTTHVAGSPVNVNTSSVNKEQLDLGWLLIGANSKSSGTARPTTVAKIDNVKIFSSPCPVAYVDAYLIDLFGNAFTIDAKLVRVSRFTIDTKLRKTGIKNFTIDARLRGVKIFTIDTILTGSKFKTFTTDAKLKGAVQKTFKIDGIILKKPGSLTTIDAILFLRNQQKIFNIDAITLGGISLTFKVDAELKGAVNKTFKIDARLIVKNKVKLFTTDALIKILGINGVCNFYPNTNFAIDTGLEQFMGPITPQHEESVDILIGQEVILNNQQVSRVTLLLRASSFPNEIIEDSLIVGKIWSGVVVGNLNGETVEATSENTINARNISGDLLPSVWTEVVFTYNPLTTSFLTGNYVIGLQHFVGPNTNDPQGVGIAIPVISGSNVIYGSAVKRKEGNSILDPLSWQYLTSISKDIVIRVEVINGNDIIQGIGNVCPKIDAELIKTNTKTFTCDAKIKQPIYKTFTCDAELVTTKTRIFIVDTVLIGGVQHPKIDAILIPSPVTFRIDGIPIVVPSKVFNTDSILKGTLPATFFIDADLKVNNINKVFNITAYLFVRRTKTFTIDGTTKYFNRVAPFRVDAFVIKEPSKFFFVDARVKKLRAVSTIKIDADLEVTIPFIFTVNAIIKNENIIKTIKADAELIVKDKEITFTISSSLSVTRPPVYFTVDATTYFRNARWRADALLRLRKTKTPTVDALLSTRIQLTNIVDARLRKVQNKTYSADALIKKVGIKTFIIDTFAEEANIKTFTIDSKLVFPFKKPKIDAKIVNRRTKTFTIDILIDPPHTVKPKVDALIKCLACSGNLFCTNIFTIDALVGIQQKNFTVDAKLNKRKTFTISVFVGELIDVGLDVESVINDGSMLGIESTFGIGGT